MQSRGRDFITSISTLHYNSPPVHMYDWFQNGYTALTRAVVYNQPLVAETLMVHRPELRLIGDNVGSPAISLTMLGLEAVM